MKLSEEAKTETQVKVQDSKSHQLPAGSSGQLYKAHA